MLLRLFGIRLGGLVMAVAGVGAVAVGLVVHRPVLMALGGLLIVSSAVRLVASRRRRAR